MANTSVNHLIDLINQQIDYQEDLSDCLSKAEALVRITLFNDFYEFSDEIKHNFLWVLSDIIENTKVIHEEALKRLFEAKTVSKKYSII